MWAAHPPGRLGRGEYPLLREPGDGVAHRMRWVVQGYRRALVNRDGHSTTRRNTPGDRAAHHLLHMFQAEAYLGIRAVHHHGADLPRIGEQVQHVQRDAEVLESGHVRGGEQHVMVGGIHGDQHVLAELGWRIHHHVIEDAAQHGQQLADQRWRDLLGVAGSNRRQQHLQARPVAGQQRGGAGGVQVASHRQRVHHGPRRVELHADRDVAEREVQVDDAHPVAGPLGQHHAQVGSERGLAAAALGREHGDDLAVAPGFLDDGGVGGHAL